MMAAAVYIGKALQVLLIRLLTLLGLAQVAFVLRQEITVRMQILETGKFLHCST